MKKVLKANQEFFYGGKTHKVGDEFEAVDPDANILIVTGRATEVVSQSVVKPDPAKLETTQVKPERAVRPDGRKRYMRRDMTAEEN